MAKVPMRARAIDDRESTTSHEFGLSCGQVVAMNQLTVNLHLMLTTFYRPTATRFKILTEAGAFSSDQYALESQIELHDLDPQRCLVELSPRPGEYTLRTEDILEAIEKHGDGLALFNWDRINSRHRHYREWDLYKGEWV